MKADIKLFKTTSYHVLCEYEVQAVIKWTVVQNEINLFVSLLKVHMKL